ncbi:MAG: endonuclease/exonuclease/phosphatase family protein [Clostridia bacterium]|nr:endonuclease/exonuclease/phosphatase family protein [Clostridia bacterium]
MKRILCLMLMLAMLVPLLAACSKGDKLTLFADDSCEIAYDPNTAVLANVQRLAKAITEATGIVPKVAPTVSEETDIFIGMVDHEDARAATSDLRINDYIAGVFGEHYVLASPMPATTNRAISYFIDEVLPQADGKLKLYASDNFRFDGVYPINEVKVGGLTLDRHSIVIPEDYDVNELYTAVSLQQLLKSSTGYDLPVVTPDHVETVGQIRIGASICEKARASAEHSYAIVGNGTTLEIVASSYLGWEGVQRALSTEIFVSGKACMLDSSTNIKGNNRGGATAPLNTQGDLRIMFNNTYGGIGAPDFPHEQRMEQLAEVYLTYMPDVLGLQEVDRDNGAGEALDKLLTAYYTEAGKLTAGEITERNNQTPLYYNADRLEIVKNGEGEEYTGNYRFSLDLNYGAYPELTEGYTHEQLKALDNTTSKGFNWAIFRVKGSDYVFMVASVHLWWRSEQVKGGKREDAYARKVQIQATKEELAKQAAIFADEMGLSADTIPIFVGGDYNTTTTRDQLLVMERETSLEVPEIDGAPVIGTAFANANTLPLTQKKTTMDSAHTANPYKTGLGIKGNVFADGLGIYVAENAATTGWNQSLDHIFMNKDAADAGMVTIHQMGMLTDLYAVLASDHLPTFVDITFNSNAPKI